MKHLWNVLLPGVGLLAGVAAWASPLPPNDLHLEDDLNRVGANIDQELFNALIDRAVAYYRPIAEVHGSTLKVERFWEDKTVNAYAKRRGSAWSIAMFGGLARRPEVTPDGFELVVCHELGHLLGGYPFYRTILGSFSWASVEGEADYFATQACARNLWRDDYDQNAAHWVTVDPIAQQRCDETWSQNSERALCYRIADASMSLAMLLARASAGGSAPAFGTPDPKEVAKTYKKHPEAQCRLDTYLEGALCTKSRVDSVIPGEKYTGYFGFFSDRKAQKESAEQSCYRADGYREGARPRCWFAALKLTPQSVHATSGSAITLQPSP